MQANRKKQQKNQRRALRIEKFEHRIVPAASIIPADSVAIIAPDPFEVGEITFALPAVERVNGTTKASKALTTGKNQVTVPYWNLGNGRTGIWTDGPINGAVKNQAPAVNSLWHDAGEEDTAKESRLEDCIFDMYIDDASSNVAQKNDMSNDYRFEHGDVRFPYVKPGAFPEDIWTDGPITSVVEKLAPVVNDLWHDAGEKDTAVVAKVGMQNLANVGLQNLSSTALAELNEVWGGWRVKHFGTVR